MECNQYPRAGLIIITPHPPLLPSRGEILKKIFSQEYFDDENHFSFLLFFDEKGSDV
jgi:hypothetical protein